MIRTQVYDENMQPFEMATAYNKNTNDGAVADLNGNIELQANSNDTIIIQALGYEDKIYKAFAVPPVIIMKPKPDDLQPVVITYNKKKTPAIFKILAGLTGFTILYQILKPKEQ